MNASDRHKRAINWIYGKPLYPEHWEDDMAWEREGDRDADPRSPTHKDARKQKKAENFKRENFKAENFKAENFERKQKRIKMIWTKIR